MKKVLIVDDEPLVLKSLQRVLKSPNVQIFCADSASQALQVLADQKIDVILCDYAMPKVLGTELLADVARRWPDTQRLILSGHADFTTVLKSIQSGVVHKFLAKPWSNVQLQQQVHSALSNNQADSEVAAVDDNSATAGKALDMEQIRLQAILNTVPDGILSYDQQGKIKSVNQALLHCFGYSETELLGAQIQQLIPQYHLASSDNRTAKLAGLKKTGEVFPLQLRSSDMSSQGFSQQLAVITDLSNWAVTETQNKQLLAALDSCQDGFALFNASGYLIRCNQKFLDLYSRCRNGPKVGTSYRSFLQDALDSGLFPKAVDDREHWLNTFVSPSAEGAEIQYQLDQQRWIQVRQTCADNDCMISFHLDISATKAIQLELQQALQQAKQATSARGKFLAMMSHEIRTPLNSVLGLLQLLHESELSDQQLKYIETASVSGNSLLKIITDILDYSKIEANKIELHPDACSLPQLAESVVQMLSVLHCDKPLSLQLQVDENIAETVLVDELRLRQVLVNLVSNALKFTPSGEVLLKLQKQGQLNYHFSVRDTGIGIPKIQQNQIFQEFNCGHDNKGNSGTGLGLAISQRIIQLMGGCIEFNSIEHSGSCFYFSLQLPSIARSEKPDICYWQFDPAPEILLVDDSQTNLLVASQMLESAGIHVSIASNGQQAISACERKMFSMVLMDISMPVMDGVTACHKIKQLSNYLKTPILALTAYAMREDKQRFLAAGMQDVIEKPIDKQLMLATIAKYFPGARSVVGVPAESRSGGTAAPEDIESPSSPAVPNVDWQAVEKLATDTSEQQLPALVDIFLQDIENRLVNIQNLTEQQISGQSKEDLQREFHTIGSSSALYGLVQLSAMARQMEALLQQQQLTEPAKLTGLINQFVEVAQQSLARLVQYLQSRKDN